MKATINNVTVEGTPKEIAEFVGLVVDASKTAKKDGITFIPRTSTAPWRKETWPGGEILFIDNRTHKATRIDGSWVGHVTINPSVGYGN
jgi:hypothetical protein